MAKKGAKKAAAKKPAKKAPPAAPSAALKAKGTPKQKAAATPPKRKASRLPSHFGGNNAPPATPEDAAKTKKALTPYAQKLLRPHTPEPADGANAGGGGGDKVAALEGTVRKLRAEVSKLKAALAEASRAARAVADQLDGAL